MLKVFADWETYYDWDYTLTEMSPAEYILDKRFEMLGCGICMDDGPPKFYPREESIDLLRSLKQPYALITHNALFDAVICALRYDVHPDILVDTMGMVRALIAHKIPSGRVSLKIVLEYFGLDAKGDTVKDMKGVHFDDIAKVPDLGIQFVAYTLRDVRGCREIYDALMPQFTAQEVRIMDTVIRMATQPKLLTHEHHLGIHLFNIESKKNDLLKRVGVDKSIFMSNDKFAALLVSLGIDPPTKISPKTGKIAYAFAKTDADFMELLDHPDENVANAVETRLAMKSTIEETRAKRFISIAQASTKTFGQAWMPVPLKYSGAHTHRLSGDWALNMQNLSNRKSNQLRSSLYAPPGYMIVAIDASQIEARLTGWLAGQQDLMEMFRQGVDIYKDFASTIYRKQVELITKVERFNAKTCVLGLGFGMSAGKLLLTIRQKAKEEGYNIEYTATECEEWTTAYRNRFRMIRSLWYHLNDLLGRMLYGRADGEKIGPCVVDQLSIVLPSQLRLNYHDLSSTDDGYTYRFGNMIRKIYGAKLVENVVQALDRQHVLEAALRTEDRCAKAGLPGIKIALQVHDENVYVLNEEIAGYVAKIAHEEMCRPSWWATGLPLAAEVKAGISYGDLRPWAYE